MNQIRNIKYRLKKFFIIAKDVFQGFAKHDNMTNAAAIAYYTIFSLPGLAITIIMTAGLFFGTEAVTGKLSESIKQIVGNSGAETVERIIKNVELTNSGTIGTIIGIGTLLFSATTIFISLQSALNKIWEVESKAKPRKGWVKFILNRLVSLGMIVSMGFILMVSLMIDVLLKLFMDRLEYMIGSTNVIILNVVSFIITLATLLIIIGLIFKLLPDKKLKWKDVFIGSSITAVLFIAGKFLIGAYLSNSDFSVTYETASSLIILLVWVYYSTVIILFGAEITRSMMDYEKGNIESDDDKKEKSTHKHAVQSTHK